MNSKYAKYVVLSFYRKSTKTHMTLLRMGKDGAPRTYNNGSLPFDDTIVDDIQNILTELGCGWTCDAAGCKRSVFEQILLDQSPLA